MRSSKYMLSLKKAWDKLCVLVEYMFLLQSLLIHCLIQTFGITGMNFRFSMETSIHLEKCFELNGVCLQDTASYWCDTSFAIGDCGDAIKIAPESEHVPSVELMKEKDSEMGADTWG